jgi:signal transduction histidine kinase
MAEQLQTSFSQLQAERDSLRRFISDASHELRTPITALKNFVLLLTGPAGEVPSTRAEFLAESETQIERLEWITRNLLDLSRLDAGLFELELAEHDVRDLLELAAAHFKARAEEKGIELQLVKPDSPLNLVCDQPRLELALGNLLDNAIKFTPPGGKVEIGARLEDDSLSIWVEDNGPGIAPEDLPHVFERFYRGQNAAGTTGSGLGLAIVKSLVEAQGGQISVVSKAGHGTRFTLKLRLTTPKPDAGISFSASLNPAREPREAITAQRRRWPGRPPG